MTEKHLHDLETQAEELMLQDPAPKLRIGLVGNYSETDETRFLLTPEACGILTSAGFEVVMEEGAAVDISFSDSAYAEYGVRIASRTETLRAGLVLSFEPLRADDILLMNKGATLLCMMDTALFDKELVNTLLRHQITVGCLNNMISHNDEPVFANILDEIDGRAAIMYAQEALSFLGSGKGVLLAGVAGINPCEVLVIGTGNRVVAAANAAIAAGASVTIMNNDVSALQVVHDCCADRATTLAIHPRVLYNKIKTADVILLDQCTREFQLPKKLTAAMKDNVYILDFQETSPSLTVPRTVAMAMSNVLVNFFDELQLKGGVRAMIASTPGMQAGIITIGGKLVDKLIGSYLGMPSVDISVLLTATN